jgi:phospholipase C
MNLVEKSYSAVVTGIFTAVNPIKRRIMKTECKVHKFINNQAINILRNDENLKAYNFLHAYIDDINAGVVWADQDLKSSNHFYNPDTEKGLYGRSNACKLFLSYYRNALSKYFAGDIRAAMFYFGAACHLVQDMTVPQHVNVKLLGHHKRYETWVKKMYLEHDHFKIRNGGIYFDSASKYIDYNARLAMEIYKRHKIEEVLDKRFHDITAEILALAQKTTAGLMLKYYNDIRKNEPLVIRRQHTKHAEIQKPH